MATFSGAIALATASFNPSITSDDGGIHPDQTVYAI